jgi:hypothetical protein
MEAGHHGAAAGALDDDGLDVDGDVERADRRTEDQQHRHQQPGVRHHRQQRQHQAGQGGRAEDDEAAAEACRGQPGQRHRQDRADAERQQQQAQHALGHAEPVLGEGHQRRPGRHDEAGDEEAEARGALLAGGLAVEAHDRSDPMS